MHTHTNAARDFTTYGKSQYTKKFRQSTDKVDWLGLSIGSQAALSLHSSNKPGNSRNGFGRHNSNI